MRFAINHYGRQSGNDIFRCMFQKMNFTFCFKFHRRFLECSNCQHVRIGLFNVWVRQRLKVYTKTDLTQILMNKHYFEMVAILCRTRCVKYTKTEDPPYWPFKHQRHTEVWVPSRYKTSFPGLGFTTVLSLTWGSLYWYDDIFILRQVPGAPCIYKE